MTPSSQCLASTPLVAWRLALHHPLFLSHRVVSKDFTFEDPNLDATNAVSRLSRAIAEIDFGAQCMQGYAAFAIPLHSSDLGAPEPARAVDPNACAPSRIADCTARFMA